MASAFGLSPDASPEAFAAAMVACQGYAPSCSDIGACQLSGDCFVSERQAIRRAMNAIGAVQREASPKVAAHLQDAIEYLRTRLSP